MGKNDGYHVMFLCAIRALAFAMSKRKVLAESDDITCAKKHKSSQRFKESYHDLWNCLNTSTKGPTFVRCNICDVDFSCAHGGKNDCKRHVTSKNHIDLKLLKTSNNLMTSYCGGNTEKSRIRAITKAELMMCEIIAESNLSLSTADQLTQSFKIMFPDSKIATSKNMLHTIDNMIYILLTEWYIINNVGYPREIIITDYLNKIVNGPIIEQYGFLLMVE